MGQPRPAAHRPWGFIPTTTFVAWWETLGQERQTAVVTSMQRVAVAGPDTRRPRVDRVHGSSVHKLKEARIDRGTRVLFAFDSNRELVALVGGDKTGKWNRWYPKHIRLAEHEYLAHERRRGKEPRCPTRRAAGRTPSPPTR
jgi:hypothetical protein